MSLTDTSSLGTAMEAPPVAGVHHLGITVRDLAASEAWYGRVLGLQRAFTETHDGCHAVVMSRPGSPLFLGLYHHDANDGSSFAEHRTGMDHVSLAVPERADLDRWAEHFDRLGVQHSPITEVQDPFPFTLIVFRDEDNVQLEVIWS
jgi:catechol 2,3-dioxygenase-like lactoylglutathione lyase family enzyme